MRKLLMTPHFPTWSKGFTLIELMIVVAVVAILAAIAMPSYTEYIRRGHRADARAGLLQAQQWMERAATANGLYPTSLPTALTWSGDASKRYTIALAAGSDTDSYTLTATPRSPGPQAGDKCGTFTLTHNGIRGAAGKKSGDAGYDPDCWGK
jgi:type IV pilus assembly protein PilE